MMRNNDIKKVADKLESKRGYVNYMSYKILSQMVNNYEKKLEESDGEKKSTTKIIFYDSNKYSTDLYSNQDLSNFIKNNARVKILMRDYYYNSVVQNLEQLVFGVNSINIEVFKNGKMPVHRLSVSYKTMQDKYPLAKALVTNIMPLIVVHKKEHKNKIVRNTDLLILEEPNSKGGNNTNADTNADTDSNANADVDANANAKDVIKL